MLDRKPPRSSASAGSHGHRLWAQRPRRRYRHRYPVKRGESSMNAIIKCAVALTGILALAGCAGMEYDDAEMRSEEHTSELQSLMRISYAVFCLKKKNKKTRQHRGNK